MTKLQLQRVTLYKPNTQSGADTHRPIDENYVQ